MLPNVAANGDHALDGVVENATWSTGRMLGKHALLFNGPTDYVSVNLPQKTDDLTLAAWICIDSLTEHQLYALAGEHRLAEARTNPLANRSRRTFGAYLHVEQPRQLRHSARDRHRPASSLDPSGLRLRPRGSGECGSTSTASTSVEAEYRATGPITIGPASIGNWRFDTYPGAFDRNFRGRMDELAIFGRPLSADEVQRMYEQGKP